MPFASKSRKSTLVTLVLLLMSPVVFSQIQLDLRGDRLPHKLKVKSDYRDSVAVYQHCQELVSQSRDFGFLAASIDSLRINSSKATARLHLGKLFPLKRLTSSLGVSFGQSSSQNEFWVQQKLSDLDAQGYPFASVDLEQTLTSKDSVALEVTIDKGPLIIMDSLVVRSEEEVSMYTLARQVGLKLGKPYNGRALAKVDQRLAALPFVSVARPSEVIFTQEEARLFVFLKKRKADRIDAIVGFQPDAEGNTVFTGEIDLMLINSFKRAEQIAFSWKRVKDNSQDLDVGFDYPFLFRSAFGLEMGLRIFRQDTTFNELRSSIGIGYVLDNGDKLSLFAKTASFSSLLSDQGTEQDLGSRTVQYGLGLRRNRLDQIFNPRKGLAYDLSLSTGDKRFSRPSNDDSVPVVEDEVTYQGELDIKYHVPIGKQGTFLLGAVAGSQTGADLLNKELYRLGGSKRLRGFDEQSVSASSFAIFTAEYRFLTGPNSFFNLFFDQALIEANTVEGYMQDEPYGFGLGASLGSGSGIFSLSYALGSQFDAPIDLRTGKIHFGYIAVF